METTQIAEFTRYVQRMAPAALRQTDPPAGWPHTEEEWTDLLERARAHFEARAAYDFVLAVAEGGWRVHELASGEPDLGTQRNVATGAAIRREAGVDVETEERAGALERALRARGIRLLDAAESIIANTARGLHSASPDTLAAVLAQAEAEVQAHDARQTAARREATTMPTLTVLVGFQGRGGRTYVPGRYRISEEEAADLEDWRAKMEAHPQSISGSPVFRQVWPPFTLEPPAPVPAPTESEPAPTRS